MKFSSPADFNDPWECRPYYSVSNLEDPKVRDRHIVWFQDVARKQRVKDRVEIDEEKFAGELAEMRDNPDFLPHMLEQSTREMADALRDKYRIFCLTTKPTHTRMWSHYADKHRGLCLEFATNGWIGDAYKVAYEMQHPAVDLTSIEDGNFTITSLLTKSSAWSDEDEFRLVNQEGGLPDIPDCKNGLVQLPKGSLQAVIMGAMISDEHRRTAEVAVERTQGQVRLLRAALRPGQFELQIEAV